MALTLCIIKIALEVIGFYTLQDFSSRIQHKVKRMENKRESEFEHNLLNFSHFTPTSPHLFFKSQKSGDPRLGEISHCLLKTKPTERDIIIAGYPDDEGIALNQGRVGASLAPDSIRQYLYKTSPGGLLSQDCSKIIDVGNLNKDLPLSGRHGEVRLRVKEALQKGIFWVGLGGGHDYAYPDGAGFLQAFGNTDPKPLVINFDAHLDVRPTDQGLSSGTPFYRLLEDKSLSDFDFFEVGIQKQCNSQNHIKWVEERGGQIIFLEELLSSGQSVFSFLSRALSQVMERRSPTFLSIDIDCFSSAYAMGCSQSWPTGFIPNELFPLLGLIYKNLDVRVLGVYEVSPPLDQDGRTAKLAGQIIHQFLDFTIYKKENLSRNNGNTLQDQALSINSSSTSGKNKNTLQNQEEAPAYGDLKTGEEMKSMGNQGFAGTSKLHSKFDRGKKVKGMENSMEDQRLENTENQEFTEKVKVFTDGASRGNPGPSAIGVVFYDEKDHLLAEFNQCLGQQTNNYAEYMAVIKALEICLVKKVKSLDLYCDSQLLVRQISGDYKVKAPQIKKLFLKVQELIKNFSQIQFHHVKRELNKKADALANQALDAL